MNKNKFFEKIKSLYAKEETIEKIDQEVESFLKTNPCDIDFLFRLAILVLHKHDHIQSIKLIYQILKCDNDNAYAILLLGYIYSTNEYIRDDMFEKLCNIKSDNSDTIAMTEHLKSWYYQTKGDYKHYETYLLKSIKLAPNFVNNNEELGHFYIRINKKKEAKIFLENALKNITHVYSDEIEDYDPYDVNEFFNERIRGIHTTSNHYSGLQRELLSL